MDDRSPHRHWIFDLDGTLTVAAHDFAAIRRALGIPARRPILEHLRDLPPAARRRTTARLDALETAIADRARPAVGARALLRTLRQRRASLGILTRNSQPNALRTLRKAGLAAYFEGAQVLGRDEAPPKPSPAGLQRLARGWRVPVERCVMVGDFRYDLEAGRAAGALTVHVDPRGRFAWPELADVRVRTLHGLLPLLAATPR